MAVSGVRNIYPDEYDAIPSYRKAVRSLQIIIREFCAT